MIREKIKYGQADFRVYFLKGSRLEAQCGNALVSGSIKLIVIHSGSLELIINGTALRLFSDDLVVISLKSSCIFLNKSTDAAIWLISFAFDFIFASSVTKPPPGYFHLFLSFVPQKASLFKRESVIIFSLIKYLRYLRGDRGIYRQELFLLAFNLLLYSLAGIFDQRCLHIVSKYNRKEKIVMDFVTHVQNHCREHHELKFYADSLFLTSGHLSRVVRDVMGQSAKQIISEFLVVEAKVLLKDTDLTIAALSEEMKFSTPSSFSNLFKKHTGKTPSEYRERFDFGY